MNGYQSTDLLTPAECARRLAVHPSTVTRWVRQGVLPALRIRGVIRVDWADVLHLAEQQRTTSEATTHVVNQRMRGDVG